MRETSNRQGGVVVVFDEATEIEVAVHAIRMGRKKVVRQGRDVLVSHTKADAVVSLVKLGLAALHANEERQQMPLFAATGEGGSVR